MKPLRELFRRSPVSSATPLIVRPDALKPSKPGWFARTVGRLSNSFAAKQAVQTVPARYSPPRAAAVTPHRPAAVSNGGRQQSAPIQQLLFPANPALVHEQRFPHVLHYSIGQAQLSQTGAAMGSMALTGALATALKSRQGFIEWGHAAQPSMVDQLRAQLELGGPVKLGNVTIEALQPIGQQEDHIHWSMLVSAPSEDGGQVIESFVVPVTQCNAAVAPGAHVDITPEFIQHSSDMVNRHLERVEWGYHDSTQMPLMLNHGVQGAAEWAGVCTEVRSRALAGLVDGPQAMGEHLQQVGAQVRVVPLPVVQQKAVVARLMAHCREQAAAQLAQNTSPSVLAQRRYIPKAPTLTRTVGLSHHVVEESQPLQVNRPRIIPETGAHPVEAARLSQVMPEQILPSTQRAYRQQQMDNHCGVAAVNGFFQAQVVSPKQMVNGMLDQREGVFCEPGTTLADLNLPGLYHPALIRALRHGQSVHMTRAEFCGPHGDRIPLDHEALYMATPEEQWNALFNYAQGAGGPREHITISPELWLSANTGMHLDQVEQMINGLLADKDQTPAWRHMPTHVARVSAQNRGGWAQIDQEIEGAVQRNVQQGRVAVFPMVCMVRGHYFAIARTEQGDWVNLGSNGTGTQGLQPAELFARRGELAARLTEVGAIHLVCEPLVSAPVESSTNLQRSRQQSAAAQAANNFLNITGGRALNGLLCASLLRGVSQDQSVVIKKSEFLAALNPEQQLDHGFLSATYAPVTQQWRALVNLCATQSAGLNWVDHADQLERIQNVEVSPAQWFELQQNLRVRQR